VPAGDQQLVPALRGAEAVDVPLHEVLGALRSRAVTSVCRVRDDGTTVDHVPLDDLRPGDRIVLPVDAGLYDEHGWNPEATGTVLDVAGLQTRTLALTTEAIASLSGQDEDDALRSLVRARSEEHTSELQSRENLVCRLLLEKKKKKTHERRRNQRRHNT